MKIAVIGAGAIGGYVGGMLARSGVDVSLLARGAHLQAMQSQGLRVQGLDGLDFTVHPRASDDPAALGRQDVLILSVKAPALPDLAPRLAPMLGPDTVIVPAMNGIPYWYFHAHPGPFAGRQLASVDPGGTIWKALPPERVVGCVVWLPASVPQPGLVRALDSAMLELGEPDGRQTARVAGIAQALETAGIKAPLRPLIRQNIWLKLWGNMSFSPCAVLTGSTLGQIARDPGTRAVVAAMMREAQAVGEALGIDFPVDVERRIAGVEKMMGHKPSMLQDWEAGRPMEIESITGVIGELGRMLGIPTPTIDMMVALVRRKAAQAEADRRAAAQPGARQAGA